MLADTLTLNNGVADQTFKLVSREGMNSKRRNVTAGVASTSQAQLVVKNTIDEKSKTKPSRHLILASEVEIDPVTGAEYRCQAHLVITRDKRSSDACVGKQVETVCALAGDATARGEILIGGN